MPSAWTQNYYHIVFSTKGREPLITPELEQRLFPLLGGVLKDLRCDPCAINGDIDHVHLALRYPADLSHSDLARHVKGRSSKWIHETFPRLAHFAWQEGYGGFTVSASALPRVVEYIQRQKEHHRRVSFREEFLELLHRHGLVADESMVFR